MIDFAKKTAELRATRATLKAASELATSETAGPAPVVAAVATGSLPVSSVLYLIERWGKNAGQWKSDVEYHKRPIFKDDPAAAISVASCEARASIYAVCIQDLRAEMACANLRQPEENTTMSQPDTGRAPSSGRSENSGA